VPTAAIPSGSGIASLGPDIATIAETMKAANPILVPIELRMSCFSTRCLVLAAATQLRNGPILPVTS